MNWLLLSIENSRKMEVKIRCVVISWPERGAAASQIEAIQTSHSTSYGHHNSFINATIDLLVHKNKQTNKLLPRAKFVSVCVCVTEKISMYKPFPKMLTVRGRERERDTSGIFKTDFCPYVCWKPLQYFFGGLSCSSFAS